MQPPAKFPETSFHQQYSADRPETRYELVAHPQPVVPESPEFWSRLAEYGTTLAEAKVVQVYCLHGTFVGNDVLGFLTELRRYSPSWSERIRRSTKGIFDLLLGETANFTSRYADDFERGISARLESPIPVSLFHWSSHNNHIGRADGAVRLLETLAGRAEELAKQGRISDEFPRVLLWTHSHGGNVVALATQLLAADHESRQSFFTATRSFYRPWFGSDSDMPEWERVESLLDNEDHPLHQLRLDVVNFGTPIRYAWHPEGCVHLLHIIQHRRPHDGEEWSTPRAFRLHRLITAADGDTVQQLGIAGTNSPGNPLATRTWLANRRLHRLLEHDLARVCLIDRLRQRMRLPQQGETLLVDYGDRGWNVPRHLFGHGCYTRRRWLPFHLEQTVKRFYSAES